MTETRRRKPRPAGPPPPAPTAPARVIVDRAHDAAILAMLLTGAKLSEIVQALGLSRPTIVKRFDDPEFRQQLEHERSDILRSARDRVGAELGPSIDRLVEIRDSPNASWASRVRASVELIRLAIGAPAMEINTTVIAGGGAETADPVAALNQFLAKLRDRAVALPAPEGPPPIDVQEVTET